MFKFLVVNVEYNNYAEINQHILILSVVSKLKTFRGL